MAYVVAEIGVNHGGSLGEAFALIGAAELAQANAVKFQVFNPEKLEAPNFRRLMLSGLLIGRGALLDCRDCATERGLDFIATPFDVESLKWVAEFGGSKIKISSGGLRDAHLLRAAAESGKELIVSTGMATGGDVYCAMEFLRDVQRVTLLQCTSAYPTAAEDVHLRAMETLRDAFGVPVGLSDHTLSLIIPAAAVAMGATVIEKHLTLDRTQEGPDHKASLEPDEFAEMVRNIREVEKALGSHDKRPLECEKPVMAIRDEREAWRAA